MKTQVLRLIAKRIAGAPPRTNTRAPTPTVWSRGEIDAVQQAGNLGESITTIKMGGSSTAVPCDVISSYSPIPGDIVEVLVLPGRLLVLGTIH